jgi:pilus assembly protein CpaF
MRPDRIIVGEVRGGEALDMLQAMNTGHDGSMSTLHANSPRDAVSRLETMVLMAGFELPSRAIREQIASAINLIIHISRLRDGTRRVTHLTELTGMESNVITLQDIYTLDHSMDLGEDGLIHASLVPTGIRPMFEERLKTEGLVIPGRLLGSSDPIRELRAK